ncbi:MAG: aminopeptidase [Chloroflexi bacterium AL-W]|nr:aminopeptidase [Chloroflexi bacterium AL-N1]NOK66045.1 aminopeptidase [Chloroflexi bacterium AL-N10]NOK72926.1 aminopeptidase [Chloroflexi bacterium AL-N5]NOK79823.1 aminopeptidase [Chloroflexi bacterium AL-W]NOK88321.1 aminopeptidase [Chloroflexi bacterium AL-N15]
MADPRVTKLAEILVGYSVEVQPEDWVLINGHVLALPLVQEVARQVIQVGAHPTILLHTDELNEIVLREASDSQLQWISPSEQITYDQVDVIMSIRAASNTRSLTSIDPRRTQMAQNARRPLQEKIRQRSAAGSLRWVGTQYPCPAYAQDADMSLSEYEDFVYAATFADQPDPVSCWQDVHCTQQRLVDWLKGKREVVVRGPHIEMTLSIEGRTFINSDGKKNMPSGEIFTGPVEESVNGWVHFTYPAIRGGREVDGVEFEFKDGKIVQARARKGEAYLLSQLDSDAGARYLGEFAVGTNYGINRFTKSILYDEKIGGTLHMAVGAGYPETGSVNESSVHWDFICDMRQESEILVDGDLFYKDGQFQV